MTDTDLHAGLLTHDPRALSYLYDHCFAPIARQTRLLGGSEADTFDVFQEAVVILYLNASTGKFQPREDSRLSTYLQGIARNVWYAQRRKASRLVAVAEVDGNPTPRDVHPLPEDDPLHDRIHDLETALATLGDKCRRLLRLFYYEKLSLRRIAELMTYTEQTAKNNKYRCVQRLRAKMGQP